MFNAPILPPSINNKNKNKTDVARDFEELRKFVK